MKVKSFLIPFLAIVALMTGCVKKEKVYIDPVLEAPTSLNLPQSAGDQTIQIKATRAWRATISYEGTAADWLSVSPETAPASTDPQTLTFTCKENTGRDRIAKVKVTIGLEDATIVVTQTGPGGSADPVFFNDFDKAAAVQTSGKWPYVSDSDCWRNETGTGIEKISYITKDNKTTIRNNSNSSGSGVNNWFFGTSSRFCVKNLALVKGKTDYTISFYGIRNVYGTTSGEGKSVFDHSQFKLYVSNDGKKWVEVAYEFEGGDPDAAWGQAKATFTVPVGTDTLSFGMPCPSETSTYRIDDVKLDLAEAPGTAVDFTKGIEIAEFNTGGDTPVTPGTPKGTGTEADPFNATAAIAQAIASGEAGSTESYYIKGFVSSKSSFSSQYGNMSFKITDEKGGSTTPFDCYAVLYLGGASFTSDDQLNVGDEVVLYAQLQNYKGNTPETKKGGKLISINGKSDPGEQFGVASTSVSAKDTDTQAVISVTGTVAWVATCDNPDFTLGTTSGTGAGDITVTFAANTAFTPKTAKITVSTAAAVATKSIVVTLTQAAAQDPSATTVELTNAEIKEALKNYLPSSATTAYSDVSITSKSGTWSGNMGVGKDKDGNLTTPYIQLRAKSGAKLLSPTFAKEITKIVLSINAATGVRTYYAMPSDTNVPTSSSSYTSTLFATNFGSVANAGSKAEEVTITVTGSQKQFLLLVNGGSAYINSIKVYLK